jgi:hypothetical protein
MTLAAGVKNVHAEAIAAAIPPQCKALPGELIQE